MEREENKEAAFNELESQIGRPTLFASAEAIGELEGGIRARRLESSKANDDVNTTLVSSWVARKTMHEKWVQRKFREHRTQLAKLKVEIKRLIVTLGEAYARASLLRSDSE